MNTKELETIYNQLQENKKIVLNYDLENIEGVTVVPINLDNYKIKTDNKSNFLDLVIEYRAIAGDYTGGLVYVELKDGLLCFDIVKEL
jgi:predicted component of type VI protein secretion system